MGMNSDFELSAVSKNAVRPTMSLEEIQRKFAQVTRGSSMERIATVAVLINIAFIFCRPQYSFSILALIQLPFFLSLMPLILYLPKISGPWTKGMKAMAGFLVLTALWGPFATNNRLAFEGFRNLFQLFVFILFPLTVFFSNLRSLKQLYKVMLWIGLFLGFYALLHSGRGPGDFMGDENDLCLVLNMFIAYPLVGLVAKKRTKDKLWTLIVLFVILAGIVSTVSRGGFVGLMLLGAYFVAKTPYKMQAFFTATLIGLMALAFAPKVYFKEMSTISNTSESTAQNRIDSWKIAWKIYLRPKNIVAGVGTRNGPLYMGEYETSKQKNLWGRQVHSVFFQLLMELGSLGVLLFLWLVRATLFDSMKLKKNLEKVKRKLIYRPRESSALMDTAAVIQPAASSEKQILVKKVSNEIEFCRQFTLVVIMSFLGVLGSGAFISILYYPPIWVVASIAGAVQLCSLKLIKLAEQLEKIEA